MENEKSTKPKNKLLKYLPRVASAVSFSFQNPPFSPGRDHHHHQHRNKGFSGPILIPDQARRRKSKDESQGDHQDEEPTSPKVSCIGQIKQKKNKMMILKSSSRHNLIHHDSNNTPSTPSRDKIKDTDKKVFSSRIRRMFARTSTSSVKASGGVGDSSGGKSDDRKSKVAAPSLGSMKRFASGRETLGNFDWTAQIAPVEYCSDDEIRRMSSDDEKEEVIIPFSAPIMMGGGRENVVMNKKKEVNLWRRRTVSPPSPLKLK